MTDTMHRHWATLRLVPRAPRKATSEDIRDGLRSHGYEVSKRTVERDLAKLSGVFPLVSDERSKPFGWSWARHAEPMDLPAMDLPTALTLHFVDAHVAPLLPHSVRAHLAPQVETAHRTLDQQGSSPLKKWTNKVMVIPQGQTLLAPEVRPGVLDAVYEAVLAGRQLEIRYRPQHAGGEAKSYTASPLGLVWRHQVCYVVATLFDYDDIKQLALHRIDHAQLTDRRVKPPKGFSLKTYVEEGAFDYPIGGKPIKLQATFTRDAGHHLTETPLSEDQRITEVDEERVRITATVADTHQLRWWLMSFGDKVEVNRPGTLRREIIETLKSAIGAYSDPKARN